MAIASSFASLRPSLLLDFANAKAVDPRITFTRSTTGKFYDGVTTAKAEENLLLQSQTFNTPWSATNATVTPDTTVAPDGTTTADTLAETASNTGHVLLQSATVTANVYVYSVFFKKGAGATAPDWIQLYTGGVLALYANFNLTTGLVGNSTMASATMTSVGSGWYRCVVSFTSSAGGLSLAIAFTNNIDTTVRGLSYAGATTSDVFIWGAQLEQRSQATAYTPTTTQPITNYIPVLQTAAAEVPRIDHNPVTGECLGLLIEEQRTNLLTWSESFRSLTLAVTGVSGTFVNGETVTATGGGTGIYVLADSTGSSFAIFNGSGTFTGTLTGGTSGATATISSSVANWTKTNSTVTANTVVAPDGTLTGDKLVEDTANSTHQAYQNFIGTTTPHTFSVYAKAGERTVVTLLHGGGNTANYDLAAGTATGSGASIVPVGNGWYRCIITQTLPDTANRSYAVRLNNGTTTSYTGDGYSGVYIWGAQLEAGAFPTSYIPTVAAQETRNADAASMTGTNFSSWFNNGEGTLYGEFARVTTSTTARVFQFDDGTVSNRLYVGGETGGGLIVVAGGVTQAAPVSGTITAGVFSKIAGAYEVNDFAVSTNGSTVGVDPSGVVPVVNRARIGVNEGATPYLNGHIRKIAYYPQALTAANLQALTA